MDGDGTPGSGATPGPGTGSTAGPAPATPAEVKAVEDELLGIVVDGPLAGGLGRPATHTTGAAPSSATPPTADDVAAYVGLVELSQPTPPLPGIGPIGSTRRLGRLLVASGLMGLFGVFLLLAVMQTRSGGGDPGDGSTTGAGGPAAAVPQGGVAQPPIDEAQPGAGGGAAQPGGAQGSTIDACAASVEEVKLEIADEEREEIRAQMGGGPVQGYQRWVRWKQVYRNTTQEGFVVVEHHTRNAGGGLEPESGWDTRSVQVPTPGDAFQETAFRGFKVSMYGAVDPAWDYVDRVAIVRDRPECMPPWKDEAVLDRIAREVPVPAAPEPD
jgi:hypothetical protein